MMFGSLFFLMSAMLSLCISWMSAALLIRISRSTFLIPSRKDIPSSNHKKNPTIAIGGIAIILATLLGFLFFIPSITGDSILILLSMVFFGAIGFFDDCAKRYNMMGISAKQKAILQCGAAFILLVIAYFVSPLFLLKAPFYVHSLWFYLPFLGWALFVIVGTVNAVNLTDGLDMLAVAVVVPILLFLFFVACYQGNYSVALINSCLIGALSGFAYFNKQPAQLWMGDVGSLSIGACIAFSALLLSIELFLPLVGAVLVFETVSVIMQVASVRYFGKRVFKIAPIHHHFQLCGYSEKGIVMRFCVVSLLANLLGGALFLLIIK